MTIILVFMLINRIAGNNLISTKVDSYETVGSHYSIDDHMDEILLLQESKWKKLDTTEKLKVLNTVANIEASNMGISHIINLGTSKLDKQILGQYSNEKYTVYIDIDHLENDDVNDVLNKSSLKSKIIFPFSILFCSCSKLFLFPAIIPSLVFSERLISNSNLLNWLFSSCKTPDIVTISDNK